MKIGIDIVLKKRIEKKLQDEKFLKVVFSPSELKNKSKLSGIFALKEAFMKALGKKIDWKDIEIETKEGKKPKIFYSKKEFKNIECSLSHDGEYVVAVVLLS